MLSNQQMEGANSGGSEQACCSDDGQVVAALRKIMRKEVEVMVISTVQKVVLPVMENFIRKVVKEEIHSAQQKFQLIGNRNDAHEINMPTERRSLQLKFLDEASLPVLTGKEIKGKGGTDMRLAIVDETTGKFVTSGLEASAKVEIVVLQANNGDNEHEWSVEDFNNRIIRESDKKKPHFAKGVYVYLKKGIGLLCNVKLGHDSSWMKSCECRLGARVVDNVSGCTVKEGWTESFVVQDSRSKLYEKHYPPSLSDDVWRLENIGKDGAPCKRLNKENIRKVKDFLFLLSIDPQRLQKMVGAGPKMWKATIDHARTCIIDDRKIYLYSSPAQTVVIFDAVGQLRGIVRDSHYIPLDNLSEIGKASAHKLLLLAVDNQKDITMVDDEESLLHHIRGTLSQTIGPPISHSNNFDMLGSVDPPISQYDGYHNTGETVNNSNSSFQGIISNSARETVLKDLDCVDDMEILHGSPSKRSPYSIPDFDTISPDFDWEVPYSIPDFDTIFPDKVTSDNCGMQQHEDFIEETNGESEILFVEQVVIPVCKPPKRWRKLFLCVKIVLCKRNGRFGRRK